MSEFCSMQYYLHSLVMDTPVSEFKETLEKEIKCHSIFIKAHLWLFSRKKFPRKREIWEWECGEAGSPSFLPPCVFDKIQREDFGGVKIFSSHLMALMCAINAVENAINKGEV